MAQYILINGKSVYSIKAGVNVDEAIAKLQEKGKTVEKCKKPPTLPTLERWVSEGGCKATDGCKVDPDGHCNHGKKSWLLVMGLI